METVIVEIYLPAVNQSYDFILPAHIPVGNLLKELIRAVNAGANVLIDEAYPCLCDAVQRKKIPLDKTLSQAGIRDSSRLMLL